MENQFKCGFVSILGPTNAGKSTLLNALLNKKISIVSSKVQTTYHGIKGIITDKNEQVIFIDTPGFQRHKESLARLLNDVAESHGKGSDLAIWVFDVSQKYPLKEITTWEKMIPNVHPPEKSVLVLNKIDKIPKLSLLPLMQSCIDLKLFHTVIPISAEKSDGVVSIRKAISSMLPVGPKMYDDDKITDRSDDFIISEFIREKVYHLTRQEIPYAVRVEVEEVPEAFQTKVPSFFVRIIADSQSRKGILVGKQGRLIKEIGVRARKDIEQWLGHKICLKTQIDVEPEWRNDKSLMKNFLELS